MESMACCAPVAQLDRAPDYESGGQEFESLRARQIFHGSWTTVSKRFLGFPFEFSPMYPAKSKPVARRRLMPPQGSSVQHDAKGCGEPDFSNYTKSFQEAFSTDGGHARQGF